MRICILRHAHVPTCVTVQRELIALREAGHEVDVICLSLDGRASREDHRGAQVFHLPLTHRRGGALRYAFEYGLSFLAMSVLVSWLHLRRKYDVVQVNTMPDWLVFAAWLPRLLGARVVIHLHEPTPELWQTLHDADRLDAVGRLQACLAARAIRFADRSITVTRALRRRLGERGSDISKMLVLPNVCREEFASLAPKLPPRQDGTFRIIQHGLLAHRYGHTVAVNAVHRLLPEMPDLHMDILGSGEAEPEVKALVARLGLQEHVHVLGYVSFEELMRRLVLADVGMVTMLRSPYSELIDTCKMYECIALRKPLIVPRLPAIEDNFDDSCMMLFEPGSVEDFARCVRVLRSDPAKRRELAENAHRRYESLKWSRTKLDYLKLMEDLRARR
jgi:glycosyltransferase involved in cell wall biosynthesis